MNQLFKDDLKSRLSEKYRKVAGKQLLWDPSLSRTLWRVFQENFVKFSEQLFSKTPVGQMQKLKTCIIE